MRCSMRWGHPRLRPTPSPHAALMQHGSLPCMAHRLVRWAPQVRRGDTGSVQSQIQPFWVGQPHPQASRRLSQLNGTNHPSNILNPPINKSKCIPLIEPLIPAQSLSLTGNGTPRLAASTVLTKAAHHNHKCPFPPSFLWFQVVLVSVRAQQCRGIGQTRATAQGDFVLAGLTKRSTAEGCKMSCGNESALWDIIQLLLNRIHHPLTALLCAKRERRQPKASETSKAVPYQHGEAWGKHHRIPPRLGWKGRKDHPVPVPAVSRLPPAQPAQVPSVAVGTHSCGQCGDLSAPWVKDPTQISLLDLHFLFKGRRWAEGRKGPPPWHRSAASTEGAGQPPHGCDICDALSLNIFNKEKQSIQTCFMIHSNCK